MNNTFYIQRSPNDLQHYGVLGMKWGVRRYQNKDGSLTNAGRSHYNKKTKEKKGLTYNIRKKASEMSDEELRANIDRMRLEQEYNRVFSEKTKSMGSRYVDDILSISDSALKTVGSVSSIGSSSDILSSSQKNKLRKVRAASKESSKILNNSQQLKFNKKYNYDLSKKSNQELRDEINRKRLEDQYTEMVLGNKKRGTDYVKRIMTGMSIATASAASIHAIKRIMSK